MSRAQAREAAFKLIYGFCIAGELNQLTRDSLRLSEGLTAADAAYFDVLTTEVVEKYPELSAIVAEVATGYALNRIYKIDLSILLLAAYELKYRADVPVPAVINEAVELAKRYSAEKSSSFVNGILAKLTDLREVTI